MLETGRTHIYTGHGKGKTTAALGLCFRAAGQGLRPCIVQFIKQRRCGEHVSAERLGIEILQGKDGGDAAATVRAQLAVAQDIVRQGTCDVLVLDEILGSLRRGYVTLEEVMALVAGRPERMELVLTGRDAPDGLVAMADLVTEMTCRRHYYETGLMAREGIEY